MVAACAGGHAGRGASSCPSTAQPSCRCECPCAQQPGHADAGADGGAVAAPSDHGKAAVPVSAQDPTWGDAEAPVTMVEFSDFECPFCGRVGPTLEELKRSYGPKQLRLVWKNFPLPFHPDARPAAEAAVVAFTLGGSPAFWKFHDLAFANQRALAPASFAAWAAQAGLSATDWNAALAARSGAGKVDEDLALARRLRVAGTPTFLVNGIELAGAQPVDKFKEVIDAQLAAAKALRAAGVAAHDVYAVLCTKNLVGAQDGAEDNTQPDDGAPPRKDVEPPSADNPSKGNADAKVTVQVFGDFQCPYCLRVLPTLAEVEQKFAGQVRVVWRNYPLPFHTEAALAAEAAQEVFVQKGAAAFWKYHDLLFAAQMGGGLGRSNLEKLAKGTGVDMRRFRAALDAHRHRAVVERDVVAGDKAGIRGIPAFVINGYFVQGAQPASVFERVITRALAAQ